MMLYWKKPTCEPTIAGLSIALVLYNFTIWNANANLTAKLKINADAYFLFWRYGHKSLLIITVPRVIKVIMISLKVVFSAAIKHRLHIH